MGNDWLKGEYRRIARNYGYGGKSKDSDVYDPVANNNVPWWWHGPNPENIPVNYKIPSHEEVEKFLEMIEKKCDICAANKVRVAAEAEADKKKRTAEAHENERQWRLLQKSIFR